MKAAIDNVSWVWLCANKTLFKKQARFVLQAVVCCPTHIFLSILRLLLPGFCHSKSPYHLTFISQFHDFFFLVLSCCIMAKYSNLIPSLVIWCLVGSILLRILAIEIFIAMIIFLTLNIFTWFFLKPSFYCFIIQITLLIYWKIFNMPSVPVALVHEVYIV